MKNDDENHAPDHSTDHLKQNQKIKGEGNMKKVSEYVDLIRKKCEPFLGKIDYDIRNYKLCRGVEQRDIPEQDFFFGSVRKGRKPKDTPIEIHDHANEWFLNEFKIKHRSESLFITGKMEDTKKYGRPYVIFPVGNFNFVWSPKVKDFLSVAIHGIHTKDELREFLERSDYTNDKFKEAVKSNNEVMINCDEYYAVNHEKYNEFIDAWKKS